MPNEVIAQIHRLAAAAEKYDGIVFTDIQGNILTEQLDDNENNTGDENTIAPGVTENVDSHVEEQHGNNDNGSHDRSAQSDQSDAEDGNENNNTDNDDESMSQQNQSYSEDRSTNSNDDAEENMQDTDEFTEDPYEQNITIDDINIVTEMNTSQMATQQLKGEENPQTHGYNLRACPTKRREQLSLAITDDVTGVDPKTNGQYLTIYPKVHAHVLLTQMNVKQGLSTFRDKGSEAISK